VGVLRRIGAHEEFKNAGHHDDGRKAVAINHQEICLLWHMESRRIVRRFYIGAISRVIRVSAAILNQSGSSSSREPRHAHQAILI
jgi:hypothetical protein